MVRLAHHKMKMKLLEDVVAADTSSASTSSSSAVTAPNRKRKTPTTTTVNASASLRTSKRSRLQSIPYQSPESVEKISIAFSEQLSKYNSQNQSVSTTTTTTTTTTANGSNDNNNSSSNESSKGKKSKSDRTTSQQKTTAIPATSKQKSNNKVSTAGGGVKASVPPPVTKKVEKITKKKSVTVSIKSTKAKAGGGPSVAVGKAKKSKASTTPVTSHSSNDGIKSKAQVKSKIFKGATATTKDVKSKSKSVGKVVVAAVDTTTTTDGQPSLPVKKAIVRKKKKEQPSEDKPSVAALPLVTQNLDNGEVPKKKKKAVKRKNEDPVVKKEEPILKKKIRRKKGTFNPKPNVTVYERDPTFEDKCDIPHVSTLADSRLLIRAVLLKDNNYLQSLIKNAKKNSICSLCVPRSISISRDALSYAIEAENITAMKLLTDEKLVSSNNTNLLAPPPELILKTETTGRNSTMMFGHALRRVEVGRGGKEGNQAFSKDKNLYGEQLSKQGFFNVDQALSYDISYSTIEKIDGLKENSYFLTSCCNNAVTAIRNGNHILAGRIIQEAIRRDGFGFNFLHEEVLTKNGQPLTPFKAVSVVKKATHSSRITPLHCSAINPNPMYLAQLLNSRPEFSILDSDNWTLLHYAAICKGPEPLKYLLSRGVISTMAVTKQQQTPLHLACTNGRLENVRLLLNYELANIAEGGGGEGDGTAPTDRLTLTSLSKINKEGLSPLQLATKHGYTEIMKLLLSSVPELDVNKQTSANFDKLSPLMLACQHGHLSVVKFLADDDNEERYNVKFELTDKRGRTALTHAVMNGHSTIVSFLLRLGVNHQVKDSSGNSLVMYAAAYGWYFNLKLLVEAGCSVKEPNHWKLSPLAVSFMKAHLGIVQYILDNGVDINSPVNDSTGVTLLLETCGSKPSEDYLERLKFILEKQHADCKVTDFEKNNALHKLVQVESSALTTARHYNPYEGTNDQKCLFSAARLLIRNGCDPHAQNEEMMSPLSMCIRSGCFSLLKEVFLENETGSLPSSGCVDKEGNTILHLLVPHLKNEVNAIYKILSKDPNNLKILSEMASIQNKKGETPLLKFLSTIKFSGRVDVNEKDPDEYNSDEDDSDKDQDEDNSENEQSQESKVKKPTVDEKASAEIQALKALLRFLVNQLQSNVNDILENQESKEQGGVEVKERNSVLHLAVECTKNNLVKEILPLLLAKKPNLEVLDGESRTPLALAVLKSEEESARLLIKAGANVNISVGGQDKPKSLLLQACAQPVANSFSLVPLLIEKGANVFGVDDKTGNSSLHLICQRPTLPFAFEAVKKLVTSGFKANSVNKEGRTGLHLVINSRGGETDATYEIEDCLIEHSPQSLSIYDSRGRCPLFYCFVKIGKFSDPSFIDPIELVTILVGAMKEAKCKELIKSVDKFGSSVLHYAAARGATISSSYLLTETGSTSIIDQPDKNGNTPYGLSVLNSHEGCSLIFQQKQGNFTLTLNCEQKEVDLNPSAAASKEKNIWQWNHTKFIEDEMRKKTSRDNVYTILEKVVRRDWQGILHLMLESLKNSGSGISPGIYAAIKTKRYKLAMKLIVRVKRRQELDIAKKEGTLLHILARYGEQGGQTGELLDKLLSKGVDIQAVDEHKSNAIIYAAMHKNLGLCTKLMEEIRKKSTETSGGGMTVSFLNIVTLLKDSLGRTPFSALFYNLTERTVLSPELKAWAKEILTYSFSSSSSAMEGDAPCEFPLELSAYPGIRYLQLEVLSPAPNIDSRFSPLIAAVIYGNFDAVKWLLSLVGKVDLNGRDAKGRTALMHAVRLNDIKMIKLLLNPKNYEPTEDNVPWDKTSCSSYNPAPSSPVNLSLRDKSGLTVLDYLIRPSSKFPSFCYANSDLILRILAKLKLSLNEKSMDGQTPLDKALKLNRQHLSSVIQELLGTHGAKQIKVSKEFEDFVSISEQPSSIPSQDFHTDAQIMEKKLMEETEAREKEKGDSDALYIPSSPDSLVTESKSFTVMMDEDQKIPFDCVLTKVDISYGMYGLYNFYKLQLLKRPKGKEMMYILFTRWGRVGDEGQYQQTPFVTAEDGIKEFKTIFKAKSGNVWEEVNRFVAIPKRYRLVHKELRQRRKYNQVKIDYNDLTASAKKNPTKMSKSVNDLIEHLSLIHKSKVSLKGVGRDCENLPFGLLTPEALAKGDKLLVEIEKLIAEKTKLAESHGNAIEPAHKTEQGQKLMDRLIELTEEFYTLIPLYGFKSEKLTPIFDSDDLREKQDVIHNILHLEFASQLLLAAQYNVDKMNVNPFEYIYKCLGTKLQLMDRQEEETQLMLQYIQNTSTGGQGVKVQNLYRIERPGELEAMEEFGVKNRWLLFHGTKSVNLLSIFSRGLQVAPIGAQLSGHMFGKGIYFADMFKKSENYCVGSGNQNFMFICEVALGKVWPVNVSWNSEDSKKPLPPGFDSIQTSDSRYQPDPGTTIHYKGRTVPLGKQTTKILGQDRYYGMDHNEFIVFNTAQVRLKYLIQFQN